MYNEEDSEEEGLNTSFGGAAFRSFNHKPQQEDLGRKGSDDPEELF